MKQDPAVEALARAVSELYAIYSTVIEAGLNSENSSPEDVLLFKDKIDERSDQFMESLTIRAMGWVEMIDRIRFRQTNKN